MYYWNINICLSCIIKYKLVIYTYIKYLLVGVKNIYQGVSKYWASDAPTRIKGTWSINDLKQGLLGKSPKGLGKPDLHHEGQMPGGTLHEILPGFHRGNINLHPNKYNQGVTDAMRTSDRQLHWWYRAREQGADQILPGWIYD